MDREDMKDEVNCFWLRGTPSPVKRDSAQLGAGAPITLVAYTLIDEKTVMYALATHNPPDVFNRRQAHDKAMGRLASGNEKLVKRINFSNETGPVVAIASHILDTCRGEISLPAPRVWLAAKLSLPTLARRYAEKQEKKKLAAK